MRDLENKKKIVIKVGSSSITHENGAIDIERIDELAKEVANLQNKGYDIVLVSSGAVACGTHGLPVDEKPNDTSGRQAVAAFGQVALMNIFNRAFGEYGYKVGQILLTGVIEDDEVMRQNAVNTIDKLFDMDVIPIVNENDTISNYQIQFGDNDTLSAILAEIIDADLLILLSDIDGLCTDDPNCNPDAELIYLVEKLGDDLLKMAKDTNSDVGTGGMSTKLNAASICMEHDIDMIIANSNDFKNLRKIIKGEKIGTYFKRRTD